jgi:hypothetical protein
MKDLARHIALRNWLGPYTPTHRKIVDEIFETARQLGFGFARFHNATWAAVFRLDRAAIRREWPSNVRRFPSV